MGYLPSPATREMISYRKRLLLWSEQADTVHTLVLKCRETNYSAWNIFLLILFYFSTVFLLVLYFCHQISFPFSPTITLRTTEKIFVSSLRFSHLASVIATPCLEFVHLLFSSFTFQIFNRFFTWDGLKNPDHTGWERWTLSVESKGAK